MNRKKKPGVMFYFDVRPCLKRMTREQQGELFCAILDYGEFGTEPEFSDPAIYFAWDFIKPRLDNDDKAYKNKCEKAKEAVEKRWEQEKKDDTDECERIQTNTPECDRNVPIPTSSSPSSPPSKANCIPPTTQGERKPKRTSLEIPTQSETGFSDAMQEVFEIWLQYKKEKKQTYQPTGLKTFIKKLKSCVEQYGDNAVIDVLERTMSSGYAGPVWDWLTKQPPKPKDGRKNDGFDDFRNA